MKKLIMLFAGAVLLTSTVFSQNVDCVSCANNVIDFTKYASGIGSSNIATGLNSLVGGTGSSALGDYSFAFGNYARAEGLSSIALGPNSLASGMYSLSIGRESMVNSNGSFSIGYMNKANADFSFIFGKYLRSNAGGTVTIGVGTSDYLINGIPYSLMIGLNSNIPTLFIGQSNGTGTTGKVGIGNVTDPQAKLHIRADTADDATLRLEPVTGSNNVSRIYFSNTNDYYIQAANYQNMVFSTISGKNYEFKNGNIGVDSDNPVAKLQVKNGDIFIEDIDRGIVMKSPDGNCWRGTLDNTGSLHFVSVNCDDLLTGQEEPQSNIKPQVRIFPNPAGDKIFVSVDPQLSGARLEITDANGRISQSVKLTNPDYYIDLTGYSGGIYIFKITGNDGKVIDSQKIIKE
jgi:hypothetical protein